MDCFGGGIPAQPGRLIRLELVPNAKGRDTCGISSYFDEIYRAPLPKHRIRKITYCISDKHAPFVRVRIVVVRVILKLAVVGSETGRIMSNNTKRHSRDQVIRKLGQADRAETRGQAQ